MSILCYRDIIFFMVVFSIEFMRLGETLSSSAVFLFLSEDVGTLVKSLQFSSWMLWYLVVMNPAS